MKEILSRYKKIQQIEHVYDEGTHSYTKINTQDYPFYQAFPTLPQDFFPFFKLSPMEQKVQRNSTPSSLKELKNYRNPFLLSSTIPLSSIIPMISNTNNTTNNTNNANNTKNTNNTNNTNNKKKTNDKMEKELKEKFLLTNGSFKKRVLEEEPIQFGWKTTIAMDIPLQISKLMNKKK